MNNNEQVKMESNR